MPTNYQANFSEPNKKCPTDYYERMRTPGCLGGTKPFTPFAKGPPPPSPLPPSGLQPPQANSTLPTTKIPSFATQAFLSNVVSQDYSSSNSFTPQNQDEPSQSQLPPRANLRKFSEVYNKTVIEQLTPELQLQAELVGASYQARDLFDNIMQEAYEFEVNSNGAEGAKEFLESPETIRMSKNEAMQEANEAVMNDTNGRYSVDVTESTPDVMVVVDNNTNEALMVMHGANSGNEATMTGRTINEFDKTSWQKSFLLPSNKTGERYPELDAIAENLIDKYPSVKTVTYSNGGPKGIYLNKEWKLPMTAFDPVIGTAQAGDLRSGLPAEAHMVRTTLPSVGMEAGKLTNPLRQISDPVATTNTSKNVKITTISPLEHTEDFPKPSNAFERLLEGHKLDQFADADAPRQFATGTRETLSKFKTGVRTTGELGRGLATGLAAGAITRSIGLEPDSQTGLITTSALNTTLDAAVAGSAAGMSTTAVSMIGGATARVALSEGAAAALGASASAASTLALPTLAAYEAANSVGQAIDRATAGWRDQGAAHALSGGLAGTTAAVTGLTANMATGTAVNVFRAVRTARAGYSAVAVAAEGTEMTAAGYSAVAAAEGAGAMASGGETAALLAFVPIPGWRLVLGAVALGTLLGVGLGWLFGPHDSPEEQQRKASEHQHEIEAKFDEIQNKFETSYSHHNLDLDSLQGSLLDPESVLSPEEVAFMNAHSSNEFFQSYNENVSHAWETERRARDIMTSLNRRRSMNPFFGIDQLSGGEQVFLHI